ncbi:hypothetical protein ACVWXP_007296 [Bradyrhizobium sp. USDA 4463]
MPRSAGSGASRQEVPSKATPADLKNSDKCSIGSPHRVFEGNRAGAQLYFLPPLGCTGAAIALPRGLGLAGDLVNIREVALYFADALSARRAASLVLQPATARASAIASDLARRCLDQGVSPNDIAGHRGRRQLRTPQAARSRAEKNSAVRDGLRLLDPSNEKGFLGGHNSAPRVLGRQIDQMLEMVAGSPATDCCPWLKAQGGSRDDRFHSTTKGRSRSNPLRLFLVGL